MELSAIHLILGLLGIGAGLLGGVIGFGTTIILMPPLVYLHGSLLTIPIIAITATIANLARVFIWWRSIDWKVCAVYAASAIPAVILGANTLILLNPRAIEIVLGLFLLFLIPIRRWMRRQEIVVSLWHMALVGAGIGYLTGIVATTGAINTPFFLAYGLTKGAYLGTEAASSLSIFITKGVVFHELGVIDHIAILEGLFLGVCVFIGSLLSKRIVLKMREEQFIQMMEWVIAISGIAILMMSMIHQ